ncbi:MAG: alanine--glyoxylate aminotransferase family protein [Bacteroidaceae bacterium]|nr:alanine--glyoxylate aminotransferase family protein [Bacteroidaceae bacterium]
MLNFTVGPVMSYEAIREIGKEQVPYFRTPEFSEVMLENERLVAQFANAPKGSRVAFMTGSGTASMETVVMNVLNRNDKAIVVNGGSFGERFEELCTLHAIPHHTIKLDYGHALTEKHLEQLNGQDFTAFVVNMHETSTGVLYDMPMISRFCKKYGLLLVVDAISAFMADPFDMEALQADVMITGSQKALACPPGISLIVLSPRALERVEQNHSVCMYLDLKLALKDGERGQTPFTPAVGILLQINRRLRDINANGGIDSEVQRMHMLAEDFRQKIHDMPLEIFNESPSNAVTCLHPLRNNAYDIFTILKDEYDIWICPNGGELRNKVFRVGHLGALTPDDNTTLVNAMKDMIKRGLL